MENNKMVSFKYIVDNCFNLYDVYIPLIQRNYKWDKKIASKLAKDLWDAFKNKKNTYTVGMITFYKESEETDFKSKMQLVDGQQRIITLFILLKIIMPNKEYFSFSFERDEGIKETKFNRKNYLKNIVSCTSLNKKEMYTDLIRFENNYKEMETKLKELESDDCKYLYKNEFVEYIMNNVFFLLHISENEPFDEFMNLNNNKTRFVISDRIKANLIIDSEDEKKEEVLTLFQDMSNILFSDKNIWELVKQGYCEKEIPNDNEEREKNKLYPDENRLKLLCCERYGSNKFDGSSTLEYEHNKEFNLLMQYYNILFSLKNDIHNQNWNSYNAFNCLYKLKKAKKEEFRFFYMLKKDKNNSQGILEKYLLYEVNKMEPFEKACFIESQLGNEKLSFNYINDNKSVEEEFNDKNGVQKLWINSGDKEFEIFKQIYLAYIDEKYNNKR